MAIYPLQGPGPELWGSEDLKECRLEVDGADEAKEKERRLERQVLCYSEVLRIISKHTIVLLALKYFSNIVTRSGPGYANNISERPPITSPSLELSQQTCEQYRAIVEPCDAFSR